MRPTKLRSEGKSENVFKCTSLIQIHAQFQLQCYYAMNQKAIGVFNVLDSAADVKI